MQNLEQTFNFQKLISKYYLSSGNNGEGPSNKSPNEHNKSPLNIIDQWLLNLKMKIKLII